MQMTTPSESKIFATSLIEIKGRKILLGCYQGDDGGIVWFHGEPSTDLNQKKTLQRYEPKSLEYQV